MAKHLNPRSCLCLPAVPALTHAVPPLLGVVHRLDDRALRPGVAVLDWKPIGELPRRHRVQLVLTAERDLDPRLLEQRPHLEGVRGSHRSILTTIKAWHPFGLAKSEVQYSHSHSFEQARNPNRQTLKSACKVFRPLLTLPQASVPGPCCSCSCTCRCTRRTFSGRGSAASAPGSAPSRTSAQGGWLEFRQCFRLPSSETRTTPISKC